MSREELDLLQEYQRTCACETETDIDLITDTIDRLTTNGKTRDGRTIIRKHRSEIVQAMKKLDDLFVEIIEPSVSCGISKITDRFYGSQFDPGKDEWVSIVVDRAGNATPFARFKTEDEADDFAQAMRKEDEEVCLRRIGGSSKTADDPSIKINWGHGRASR